jgi:hypothetical protein
MVANEVEQRRFQRVALPIFFRDARRRDAKKPIIDIGLGGLRVYSDEPFTVGDRYTIEIFLEDGRSLTGLVRAAWIEPLADGPARFDVGFELLATDPDQLEHLKAIIEAAAKNPKT